MYVKAIIILCIVIIILVIYLSCRGRSNRSRVPGNKNIINGLKEGVAATRQSVDRIESGLEDLSVNNKSAIKRTEDIKQHNNNAREGIDKALGILEAAKNRDNT